MTFPTRDGPERSSVRLAAVGDLHCTKASVGQYAAWLGKANEEADMLLLCGDLTDYGTPEETRILAKELGVVRIPMLGVLGNHDYESGKEREVTEILTGAGVTLLDGDSIEVAGVGFTGVKGFAGGFGSHTLGHWGERTIKQFVDYAIEEALKLETGLARLRTDHRVVLMHYSPIAQTVQGEPLEIFPFLGCSRLEEPLLRYEVSAVFHGHAHRGALEGRTRREQPVYNVALPLLRRSFPDRPYYRVVELTMAHTSLGEASHTEAL